MSKEPLVSIIIPTYNRSNLICRTIDNAFGQTYSNFELIIVDDGSTDETQSKLRKYGKRIRILTQANAGPAIARNRGAEAARGEIIAFQDSDDLWMPDKLERQIALLDKVGPAVPCCLCNVLMRMVKGKQLTSYDLSLIHLDREESVWLNALEVLASRFVLFNQAVAIRRVAFEKIGGFREDVKYDEDYDLALRLALEGPWAIIKDPLVMYGEGSPESFSGQALRNPVILKQSELAIFEQVLSRVEMESREASVQRQLRHRLKTFRLGMRGAKLRQAESRLARFAGKLVANLDRFYFAAFRRSPWFPALVTVPPIKWAADRQGS